MCYITAHERQKSTYVDDAISSRRRVIPNNTTTEALKPIGATLNFIDLWIKQFQHNYQEILEMYHEYMVELFE